MSLRPFDVYAKELAIIGSYTRAYDTWPRAIALLAEGGFGPSMIVDSIRPLAEAVEALNGLATDPLHRQGSHPSLSLGEKAVDYQ
jgi:threonine dehydrogenase-like Zn-dependent dehydrogenase